MKKFCCLVLALLLLLITPVAAADMYSDMNLDEHSIVYENTFSEWIDTSGRSVVTTGNDPPKEYGFYKLKVEDITKLSEMCYITLVAPYDIFPGSREPGVYPFTAKVSGRTFNGRFHYQISTNILGQVTSSRVIYFFDDWDVNGLDGSHIIEFSPGFSLDYNSTIVEPTGDSLLTIPPYTSYGVVCPVNYEISHTSGILWENRLVVTEYEMDHYQIDIIRIINGEYSKSTINILDDFGNIMAESTDIDDQTFWLPKSEAKQITITSPQTTYTIPLGHTDPDEPSEDSGLTVYIKNSQTGALIANANVVIDALVDGEYYTVTNRTEPSGIFTINLQPTGGGKPNPDGYRLIVTADGYNNPMPEINFTLGDYRKYFECFLDPIAGGPVNEDNTFIDFFVRDMSSNPISGATVKFGKYTLITNSAGYTVFEVEKNNNYTWTVSKSGYGALTGNAVIGNDPRHTINTVLAPIVTPTTTTPIPTSPPIGPTPTMTAPTGEPVSNWLEWFAAHFGMILGGGVEIGKIFMWLCFTVPVGVYVGKEAKAGAAGFMAGAGIVTLFFVLIGWVPIWLVVLLALIIGLLYAKEFNAPDNGGGR